MSARVAIVMGSASDKPTMQKAADELERLGVGTEMRVLSAHRTPDALREWVVDLEGRGVRVVIAAAGYAAHLAGVVAAHTTMPVIGVPLPGSSLNGLDSLLSTVQMPRGIPVATVTIGEAGAVNAAILATEILGTSDDALRSKLRAERKAQAQKILDAEAR